MANQSLETLQQTYNGAIDQWYEGDADDRHLGLMNEVADAAVECADLVPARIFSFAMHGMKGADHLTARNEYVNLVYDFLAARVGHVFTPSATTVDGPEVYMAFDSKNLRDPGVGRLPLKSPLEFRIGKSSGKYVGTVSLSAFSVKRTFLPGDIGRLESVEEQVGLNLFAVRRVSSVDYPHHRERLLVSWRNDIPIYRHLDSPARYAEAAQQVAEAEELLISHPNFRMFA